MTVDDPLIEMFRAEAETHLATLNSGLLTLERNPAQYEWFESLMRAAHSIKGAAKIVGRPSAVQIAHHIESCFVGLQGQPDGLSPPLVDILLQGVDLLDAACRSDLSEEQLDLSATRFAETLANTLSRRDPHTASPPASPRGALSDKFEGTPPLVRFEPPRTLDVTWAVEIHERLATSLRDRRTRVCLDLAFVEELDPIGVGLLAALLGVKSESRETGFGRQNPFWLAHVSPRLKRGLRAFGISIGQRPTDLED